MQDDDISKSALVRYGLCLAGVWKVGPNLAPTTSILLCLLLYLPTPIPRRRARPPHSRLRSPSYPVRRARPGRRSALRHPKTSIFLLPQPRTLDYGRSHALVPHVLPGSHPQLPPTVPDPSTTTAVSTARPPDDVGAL